MTENDFLRLKAGMVVSKRLIKKENQYSFMYG